MPARAVTVRCPFLHPPLRRRGVPAGDGTREGGLERGNRGPQNLGVGAWRGSVGERFRRRQLHAAESEGGSDLGGKCGAPAALARASPAYNFGTADRGLCRGTISATLCSDFGPLPATGKSATAPIAEIVRIAEGQIVEVWVYPDTLSIMKQFGLIATSGGA